MKSFKVLLFLALVGSATSQVEPSLSSAGSSCRSDEEWRQCSTCEPTCDNPTPSCVKMCQPPKCMCKTNTFRSLDGSCVSATLCPSDTALGNSSQGHGGSTKCPENEGIKTCSGCEPTCEVPNPICNKMCKQSRTCECLPGKYRNNESNKCVEAVECPLNTAARNLGGNTNDKTCGENEELKSCPGCEPKCGHLDLMCPMICRLGQECECKAGYARTTDGKCVKYEDCPPTPSTSAPRVIRSNTTDLECEENEVVTECSGCEAECNFLNKMCPMSCNGIKKCECASGYARDHISKKCILREQCPLSMEPPSDDTNSTCGKNEELRSCPGCEPSCKNPNPICPMICRESMECQCKQGFVRNDAKECVQLSECPSTPPDGGEHSCPPNEKWTTCGGCEGSCDNPNPICTLQCRPAGCYCNKRNHVRGPDGQCIHKKRCDNVANTTNADDTMPDICAATTCPIGTICKASAVQCIKAPCPPIPACVPIDELANNRPITRNPFCERARCAFGPCLAVGIKCKTLDDCEYIGQCINRTANGADFDVCANSTCPEGSQCEAEVIQCFAPPCLNIPKCVPTKQSVNPSLPVVRDACDALDCPAGQICRKNIGPCSTNPCPPIAECVDVSNSTDVLEDPCASMRCAEGTVCTELKIFCVKAPCPRRAQCINETDTAESGRQVRDTGSDAETPPAIVNKFCSRVRCAHCITSGIKCNPDGSNCEYLGQCVGRNRDPSTIDVCKESTCPTGQHCVAEKVECFAAPCFPIPKCVSNDATNSESV